MAFCDFGIESGAFRSVLCLWEKRGRLAVKAAFQVRSMRDRLKQKRHVPESGNFQIYRKTILLSMEISIWSICKQRTTRIHLELRPMKIVQMQKEVINLLVEHGRNRLLMKETI